uniref:Transposase n=1 Tax=Globodera rostochiensis TaxID=31243 RepID=A0A914HIS6_GLORO
MDEIKMSQHGEKIKIIKDLGISRDKFYRWQKEFGLPVNSKIIYSDKEKKRLMKIYYKIKQRNPKISDLAITNFLNIGSATLKRWKKQFVNSVGEHYSLPENGSSVEHHNDSSEHPMPSTDDNL